MLKYAGPYITLKGGKVDISHNKNGKSNLNSMRKKIITFAIACFMAMNLVLPSFAAVPPPGYTQGTEAGGSVSTDVSINIPGSGESGETGGGDDSGFGDETGDVQDSAQYKYKIYYYYDDSVQRDFGYAPLGSKTPYRLDTPLKYAGSNWILDTFDVAEYVTEVEEDNVSTVYYAKDDLDKDGNPVEGGDGIPDKYQDPDNLISTLESYGYNVTYDYLDKEAMTSNGTQSFSGAASLGSAIPYSMPNVRTFEAREYRLNSVAASSYTITPEAEKNTIELTYVSMEENEKADKVPTAYLVTFDPDNGDGIDTVPVEEGKAVSEPAAPVKDGYSFLYWAYPKTTVTSETETIPGDDGAMHEVTVEKSKTTYMQYDFSSPVESNLGLKAIYEVENGMVEYEVRHYTQALEEGAYMEYLLAETEKKAGRAGASVTAEARSYAGFVLDTENPGAVPSGTVQEGLVLALYYNRAEVNVTINPDNGGEVTQRIVKAGSMIPVPETPVKEGCEFDGWVSDGNPFVFTTPVKTDITITAKWHTLGEEASYNVEHYKETQDGSYELADREMVMSKDGANVNAEAKDYPGFVENWQHPDRVSYGQVSAATPLVLRLYYDHSEKPQATCDAPTAKTDLVYNGNPQELVNPGSTTDGTIKYSLNKDGPWSEDVPTGIESGSYDVYYYVEGDDDHENSDVMGPVSVVVEPRGNIDVKVTNYAPTKAIWEAPADGWITGSNMFTVTSNMACAVALVRDGEVAVLSCEQREANTYAFMAELTDGDEIVIVLVGDSDLDGKLTVADLVCLSRHFGGMCDLSACAALAADADLDDKLTVADLVCLSQYFGGMYTLRWRLDK